MKIKLDGKEYTVKFGYAPVYKNKIIPRLVGMEQKGEGLEVIDNMLGFLPEFLLVGLQKFHADEFGFDFDDKEAKEKQLAKMYDLLDDYLDPENEEGGDIMSLYNDLSAEMEKKHWEYEERELTQDEYSQYLIAMEQAKEINEHSDEEAIDNYTRQLMDEGVL